jgi:probable HAF family extracellular repeat protein
LDINNSGQVVGDSTIASGKAHAFRTAPNSPINPLTDDLGTLGGTSSIALDINNSGQVVGDSTIASGNAHAFRTAPNSPINPLTDDLGTLGGTYSIASGINNSGQVVGRSLIASGYSHAFLYSSGRMLDLNDLLPSSSGWVLTVAGDINDDGQIAGTGNIAGQIHGFLATPVNPSPTPATGGSITVGNVTTSGIGGPVIMSARDNIQTSSITTTGGSIQLTSGGIINTTSGVLDSSSISGNGGAISLTANGDITTKTLVSGSYSFGNGGNISLTSTAGTINTKAGDVLSFTNGDNDGSGKLNGGAITFSAFGDITTANLDSRGFGFANHGGDMHLTSINGGINTEAGTLRSRSRVGNAGEITLSANSNIIANYIEAYSAFANGGNITLATTKGDITLGSIDSRSLLPDGFGNGGNINLTSNSKVSVANSFIFSDTFGSGKAGDINIQATSVSLTNGTQISASTNGTGKGGNLTLNASDFIEFSGTSPVVVAAGTYATGNAGNLTINTGELIVRDGASIASSVAQTSTGRGGNVTVNASNSVELDGTSPDGQLPSRIATATAGKGDAGNLEINTRQLIVKNGAVISTATANSGKGGNLTVNSDSVELTGTSADGQLLSALSTDTGGTGKGGDLTINTRQLTIRDGGAASSSSFSQGQGGTLTANASEFVELRGTAANGFGSGLYAQGFSSSTGGNLKVTTGDLRIFDRARITVAAGATAETRVPTARLSGVGVNPGDRATGNAGNLEVEANSIYLNNQGAIFASTTSGEGGNIKLTARDLLLMRHNSLISAEAGGTGNGGNVTIDAQFIVGVPKENSDIIANAFKGNGGRVQITTQGIYGLQYRPQRTPLSDITASSQFGVNGTVQINTPDVDPSRGLANLPENLVDTSALIANSCIARSSQQGGSFTITGRGGLPTRPGDPFTSPYPTGTVRSLPSTSASNHAPGSNLEVTNPEHSQPRRVTEPIDRIRQSTQAQNHPDAASFHTPTPPTPAPLVEASGWVYGANGEVILTAQSPTVTPHSSWSTLPTCPE